jgi:hypothetical protein
MSKSKTRVKPSAHRAGLPGNVDTITVSAFLPAYLPTAGRQGGASSRPAREEEMRRDAFFNSKGIV